jgi:hypothetical protein
MAPTLGHGKICYLELPTDDVERSATFYAEVFGWGVRHRADGYLAFDDGVGEVSGSWVLGRTPAASPGVLVYVWVDDVDEALGRVIANGGRVVQPVGGDPGELTARVVDPAGNIIGVYQEPVDASDP